MTAAEELLTRGEAGTDVLVLSPKVKEPDAFGFSRFVNRRSPATAVVMVRDQPLNGKISDAMRAGVRDIVDLSQGGQDLREALERAIAWSGNVRTAGGEATRPDRERGVVVSVFSSKGGTGKSFISSNLSAAIASQGSTEVALVDFDIEIGDVFSYFGKEARGTLQDLLGAAGSDDRDAIVAVGTELEKGIIGFGGPPEPGAAPLPGENIGVLLRTLRDVFPFTVVDCPASYSDHALAALELSDVIYLMATLDIVGLRHLSVALNTLVSLGLPRDRMRVVLNRSDSKVGLSPDDVLRVLKFEVDAMIPSSRLVPTALNKGRPVVLDEPKSNVSKSIIALAGKVLAMRAAAPLPSAHAGRRLFSRK